MYKNPSTVIETDFVDCGSNLHKIKKENTDVFNIEKDYRYEDEPTIKDEDKEMKKREIKKIKTHIIVTKYDENEPTNNDTVTLYNNVEIGQKVKKEIVYSRRKEYTVTVMDSKQFKEITDSRRTDLKNEFKCNHCILEFENDCELNAHNLEFHTKVKSKHIYVLNIIL